MLEAGARELRLVLRPARALDVVVVDESEHPLAGASLEVTSTDPLPYAAVTGADGQLLGTATFPELRALGTRGCPVHGFACDCAVLGMPPAVDRYRPTPAQRRFVTTRDRTCRMPGCPNKAAWADLDHVIPHACGGETACTNLCCLCRRHHRLKTHARGWRFVMADDGTLTVTTPAGISHTTRPPGLTAPPAETFGPDEPPPF